jgi:RNA polymerase sigma-70 factor (ECF subfamily)
MNIFNLRKHIAEYSDNELLRKYKANGDKAYFGELFKRYSDTTYLVCIKYLKDSERAKDAVMDIFEILLSKLLVHDVDNFKSWLYVVAKNHCLMLLKNKKVTVDFEKIENTEVFFVENNAEINLFGDGVISRDVLLKAINELNENQKKCIVSFYLEKMSYKEIALKENLTEKQVKSYIQNGKRNLRIKLKNYSDENNE